VRRCRIPWGPLVTTVPVLRICTDQSVHLCDSHARDEHSNRKKVRYERDSNEHARRRCGRTHLTGAPGVFQIECSQPTVLNLKRACAMWLCGSRLSARAKGAEDPTRRCQREVMRQWRTVRARRLAGARGSVRSAIRRREGRRVRRHGACVVDGGRAKIVQVFDFFCLQCRFYLESVTAICRLLSSCLTYSG
jgi:hypothetical protein